MLLIASVAVGGLANPIAVHGQSEGNSGYIVEPGDFLLRIAREHGTPIADLLRANGLTLSSVIHPGQHLVIPARQGAPASSPVGGPPPSGGTYIVRAGDSLYAISRRRGVSLAALLAANRLTASSTILPGQRLVVLPGAVSSPPTGSAGGRSTYAVRAGDSLYGISRRLGVTLTSLLAANDLTVSSMIHPGQVLRVPSATGAPGPTSPRPATTTPASSTAGAYVVRSGDSLFGISRALGVSFAALLDANGLTPATLILPGMTLSVPAGRGPVPPTTPPPTAPNGVSTAGAERIIRQVWPDDLEQMAVDIARRESGLRPTAQNACCVGLFQIYYDVHSGWLASMGIGSRHALFDARTNARAALALYQQAGWAPWALSPAP
jgi:LysM repeat protein